MRRVLAIGLVLLVGCAGPRVFPPVAATQPVEQPGTWFASQSAHIRFRYPASWHPVKGEATLTLVPLGESFPGPHRLTIDDPELPFHLPGMIPLGAVEAGFVADLRNRYNQTQETSSVEYDLAGVKCRRISAAGQGKNGPVVVYAVLCVRDDSVYVIDAETDTAGAVAAEQAFDMVLDSWQWME